MNVLWGNKFIIREMMNGDWTATCKRMIVRIPSLGRYRLIALGSLPNPRVYEAVTAFP